MPVDSLSDFVLPIDKITAVAKLISISTLMVHLIMC